MAAPDRQREWDASYGPHSAREDVEAMAGLMAQSAGLPLLAKYLAED